MACLFAFAGFGVVGYSSRPQIRIPNRLKRPNLWAIIRSRSRRADEEGAGREANILGAEVLAATGPTQ